MIADIVTTECCHPLLRGLVQLYRPRPPGADLCVSKRSWSFWPRSETDASALSNHGINLWGKVLWD